jgi:hypothetical protein
MDIKNKRGDIMTKIIGKVEEYKSNFRIEFGRTQANMSFSKRGTLARKLKLEDGDKIAVSVEKI